MKLFCVGCGPGDPELLTVRAVNLIKSAEVIFAPTAREGKPSIALSVVEKYIDRSTKTVSLVFPMVKDRESLKDYWKRNAEEIAGAVRSGKNVVYLTVGDPALYSTWIYIHRELKKSHKDVEVEIVPGITSIFAIAAKAKISLAEGEETVAVVPACYDMERVKRTANACDTVIFLKDGRYFDSVIDMLAQAGFPGDATIAIAQDVSDEGEILEVKKLSDLQGKKGPTEKYFSIMVAKKNVGRD
ncbi:MAG TPA: precorrin-2 C(20)-methyltransferase [Nitrososphaera sp.]|jgi:precorrin-2/cobalt-factor-2 C20-methyltransferase|nr:precorrin-2 C(20)-methyltransferase [Nitrososphaera sp.]HEX2614228.1 precorrin-2 C(20)-methyltransferase [Nitrososphaera sp.]